MYDLVGVAKGVALNTMWASNVATIMINYITVMNRAIMIA